VRGVDRMVPGGGVAAKNSRRQRAAETCEKTGIRLSPSLLAACTDNAAMDDEVPELALGPAAQAEALERVELVSGELDDQVLERAAIVVGLVAAVAARPGLAGRRAVALAVVDGSQTVEHSAAPVAGSGCRARSA